MSKQNGPIICRLVDLISDNTVGARSYVAKTPKAFCRIIFALFQYLVTQMVTGYGPFCKFDHMLINLLLCNHCVLKMATTNKEVNTFGFQNSMMNSFFQ